MMSERLTVQTREGAMVLDAEAIAPGIFIHKSVTDHDRTHATAYTISHATGYALGNNYTRDEALAAAERLAELGSWDWTDMRDKPDTITLESVQIASDRIV
jgi:hypothetical protein